LTNASLYENKKHVLRKPMFMSTRPLNYLKHWIFAVPCLGGAAAGVVVMT
jgi:hypothetical protein